MSFTTFMFEEYVRLVLFVERFPVKQCLIAENVYSFGNFLSLLPENSVIFVATSFPCPDLTVIGRSNGMLGLVGDRSVLIHCGWGPGGSFYLSLTSSL